MNYAKKILCLMLTLLILLSCISCQGNTVDGKETKESNTVETESDTIETYVENSEEELLKPEQKNYNRELKFMVDGNYYCYVPDDYQYGEGDVIRQLDAA